MPVATSTPPYADPDGLRRALLGAGLLVDTGVPGLYHRSAAFEGVVTAVERYASSLATDPGRTRTFLPPVLPREAFLRTDYLRSFPDLAGSVRVFTGGDTEHRRLLATLDDGGDWDAELSPAEVMLASSVCHSVYGTLPADVPADGHRVECSGYSFRHEPSADPMRMQVFRMLEHVFVGTPQRALDHRQEWLDRGLTALADLGLPVRAVVAHDPFFGRAGRMLAANQLGGGLKRELVVDVTAARETAIASANYHEDHFGTPFGLHTPDGAPAHSACFGFGLERVSIALLAVHGMDVGAWPDDVTRRLEL